MKKTVLIIILTISLLMVAAPATAGLRADINGDGRVDIKDLAIMAQEWMMSKVYYEVIGDLTPDATGIYVQTKDDNDQEVLKRLDGVYGSRIVSSKRIIGAIGSNSFWQKDPSGEDWTGEYPAIKGFGGTGTATIVLSDYLSAEKTESMRTRRSRLVIR